jgi:hypothetical protein
MAPIQLPSEEMPDKSLSPNFQTSDFKIGGSSVIELIPTVVHPKPKPRLKKSKTHGTNQSISLQTIDENVSVIKDS